MATPSAFPASIDIALPGAGKFNVLDLSQIPSRANVTAKLVLSGSAANAIKLDHVTVFDVVEITIPADPNDPGLPPGHPDEPQTLTELKEADSSDGTRPLAVAPGQVVKIGLRAESVGNDFGGAQGTLRITGDTWDPLSVPISLGRLGEVQTTLAVTGFTVRQGSSVSTDAIVSWVAGPAVEVSYHLVPDMDASGIELTAPKLTIHPQESQSASFSFQVASDCPRGSKVLRVIQEGGFSREILVHTDVVAPNAVLPMPVDPDSLIPTGPSGASTAIRELGRATRAIDAKRARLGDVTGPPLVPDGAAPVRNMHPGGFVREFFRGSIYFNKTVRDEAFFVGHANQKYRQLGGPAGHLGWPISDDLQDPAEPRGVGVTRFLNGALYWWPDIGTIEMVPIVVRFVGLHCFGTTSGPGADEPYATFGAVSVNGERTPDPAPQTQIFEDVDRGESHVESLDIIQVLPFGMKLALTLSEHDAGDPHKYKDEIGNLVDKVGDRIAELLTAVPAVGTVLSVAASIGFALAGPTIAEKLSELLGTDDDFIGTHEFKLTGKDLMRMARDDDTDFDGVGIAASFATPLLTGDGGSYKLYFSVSVVG